MERFWGRRGIVSCTPSGEGEEVWGGCGGGKVDRWRRKRLEMGGGKKNEEEVNKMQPPGRTNRYKASKGSMATKD